MKLTFGIDRKGSSCTSNIQAIIDSGVNIPPGTHLKIESGSQIKENPLKGRDAQGRQLDAPA